MKQILKIILFSSLIGTILAALFFFNIKDKTEAKNISKVYAFQVGAFKNIDNANALKEKYVAAKVVKNEEYYRVFIGVTVNNEEMLQKIYENETFYIKELIVSDELVATISKYDEFLEKSAEENKILVIKNMLESIPDEL